MLLRCRLRLGKSPQRTADNAHARLSGMAGVPSGRFRAPRAADSACFAVLMTGLIATAAAHACVHDALVQRNKDAGVDVFRTIPADYGPEYHALLGIPRPEDHAALFARDNQIRAADPTLVRAPPPPPSLRAQPPAPDGASDAEVYLRSSKSALRLTISTSMLDDGADGNRACYSSGATFVVGTDSGSVCGSSVTTNCHGTCTSDMVLTSDKVSFVRDTILPKVLSYFQGSLRVVPLSDGVLFPDSMSSCGYDGGVTLSTHTYSDTDYVLFLTGRPTFGSTAAWAGQCVQDQLGRPLGGQANWGPAHIYPNDPSKVDSQFSVLVHEITHALGFSGEKFLTFKDEAGNPRTNPVRTVTKVYGGSTYHTVWQLATPRALEVARHHFDCDTLEGVQLEDGGGSGSEHSHWEKRLFMNEYMTATVSDNPIISSLTLAALADSGWYDAEYEDPELDPLLWGYKAGCSFCTDDCGTWTGSYTCAYASPASTGCAPVGLSKGSCNAVTYSTARDVWYQHYTSPNVGGTSSYADYCAYIVASTGGDCTVAGNAPADAATRAEMYGSASRCFTATVHNATAAAPTSAVPACYETRCSGTTLEVRIGTEWVTCPTAGGLFTLDSGLPYAGSLTCPRADTLCPWPKSVFAPTYSVSAATRAAATPHALLALFIPAVVWCAVVLRVL